MEDEWSTVSVKKTVTLGAQQPLTIKKDLLLDDPITPYMPKTAHGTSISKDKQVYFSELEFLTEYSSQSKRILYFKSKHSLYLPNLIAKFPDHIWIIVDTSSEMTSDNKNIIILDKSSIDDGFIKECNESGGFILISNQFEAGETEQITRTLIAEQNVMLQSYKAKISLVRFRAPYPKSSKDIIVVPVCLFKFITCAKADSTETCLIIFRENLTTPLKINCQHYEQLMAYHNQVRRANHRYDSQLLEERQILI